MQSFYHLPLPQIKASRLGLKAFSTSMSYLEDWKK